MMPTCLILDAFALGDILRLGLLDHTLTLGIPTFTSPLVRQEVIEDCGVDPCDQEAAGKKLVINQADVSATLIHMRRHGLLMSEAAVLALADVAEGSVLVARFQQGRAGTRWLVERLAQKLGARASTMILIRVRWSLQPDGGPRIVDSRAASA